MEIFTTLVLMAVFAVVLLPLARRLGIPYPTLLALAGVGIASFPGVPMIDVAPSVALALFIAPALLHSAYGTSPQDLGRYWFSLTAFAVFSVAVTAGAVAVLGHAFLSLPWPAALALGAIVAPPDAAASDAVLQQVDIPRRGRLLLEGESLLNDATALTIFGLAVAFASSRSASSLPMLVAAAPGGVALGLLAGVLYLRFNGIFANSRSAPLADLVLTIGLWLLADALKVSAALSVVSFGLLVGTLHGRQQSARDRVQANAVYPSAVLILNLVAFLLIGMQARRIVLQLAPPDLMQAAEFALLVLATVVVVRIAWTFLVRYVEGAVAARFKPTWLPAPASWALATALAWSGSRGLVTLVTAFALPADVVGRDVIILSAFTVVLGTPVLQGLTLSPLLKWLGLSNPEERTTKLANARREMLETALEVLGRRAEPSARALALRYSDALKNASDWRTSQRLTSFEEMEVAILSRQRDELQRLLTSGSISRDIYATILEELDWADLAARSHAEGRPLAD